MVQTSNTNKLENIFKKSVPRIFILTSCDYFDNKTIFLRLTNTENYWN